MKEPTPEQYCVEARRFHDMAEQEDDPVKKDTYRQIERSYLKLAEGQELLSRPSGGAPTKAPKAPR
jgi:hypothetical protein